MQTFRMEQHVKSTGDITLQEISEQILMQQSADLGLKVALQFSSSVTYGDPPPLTSKRLPTLFAVRLSNCDNARHASTVPILFVRECFSRTESV